jgi:arylformamidase
MRGRMRADVRYGEHADETLDLFPVPGKNDAPLFVFVHGGYWRALGPRRIRSSWRNAFHPARHRGGRRSTTRCRPEASGSMKSWRNAGAVWLGCTGNGAAHGVDVNRIVVAAAPRAGTWARMLLAPRLAG